MGRRWPWLLALLFGASQVLANESGNRLYMPDGQLTARLVEVFLYDINLEPPRKPARVELCLARVETDHGDDAAGTRYCDGFRFSPAMVLPNQQWKDVLQPAGQGFVPVARGTRLLFDLRELPIHILLPGYRVQPVLEWTLDGEQVNYATSEGSVYLSARFGVLLWTLLIVAGILYLVYRLTRHDEPNGWRGLFCTADGRMSVSMVQMGLWTLGVGSMVLGFGLMRLQVPEIPATLVVLMGMSVGTSTMGHFQAQRLIMEMKTGKRRGRISDIVMTTVTVLDENGRPKVVEDSSLVKAQMLFWTVITLTLFVVKTVIEGELWVVPDTMVGLMGLSQAGFLVRKEMALWETRKMRKEHARDALLPVPEESPGPIDEQQREDRNA